MVNDGGVLKGRGLGMAQDWILLLWWSRSVLDETHEIGGQSAGDGVVQGNDIVSY
jgi:hypothetical protein